MGPGLVSFLLAVGGGTWIYTKFMRSTGNNTKNAVIGAGISGLIIFLVAFLILQLIF